MSTTLQPARTDVVVPETPADARTVETHPAWLRLKAAATALQPLQVKDGSVSYTHLTLPTIYSV